jgi:hypothetical protein
MVDIMKAFAEQFGLAPLYAVIIAYVSFNAINFRHLITLISILSGVYIAMFKAFNLKAQFGVVDVTQYLPVSKDSGNMIVAVAFVCVIGFTAYGVKRIYVSQRG